MTEAGERRPKFPVGLSLEGRSVVVVGGGRVATRRILKLLECGACVTVIAPRADEALQALAAREDGGLVWHARPAVAADMESAPVVFLATDDEQVNSQLAEAARRAGALVNRADRAEESDFVVPLSWRRAGLTVALFSGETSPAFTRWVSDRIQESLQPEMETFAALVARARERILNLESLTQPERADLIGRVVRGDVFSILLRDGLEAAERRVDEILGAA